MLKFRAYIAEIFDKHYPYEKDEITPHTHFHRYKFENKDKRPFNVDIEHQGDDYYDSNAPIHTAHVTFDTQGRMEKTGLNPKDSHKILGTVKHIVMNHISKHPHIKHVEFSAVSHPEQGDSRKRLYKRMVAQHGGEEHHVDYLEKKYRVPVNQDK